MKKFLAANRKFILFIVLGYVIISLVLNYVNNSLTNELSDKTWIHRVNSTEKLKEVAQKNYNGIELDVVFLEGSNTFDVNHPPAISIDLSLESYLRSLDSFDRTRFWIDFKNLSASNTFAAVSRFDSICNILKINKKRFIIESDKPKFLTTFQNSGYKTSFYLPTSLCNTTPDEFEKAFNLVQNDVRNYKTDYLSLDKCNYQLITEKFPGRAKLLWSFPDRGRLVLNPLRLLKMPEQIALKRKLVQDENVEAVLFAYNAKFGNR